MSTSIKHKVEPQPPGPPDPCELGAGDDTLERLVGWSREYGDTYRVFTPAREAWIWVVQHPDDIKRVLVSNHRNYTKGVGIDRVKLLLGNGIMTSEGEFWRRQRRMMQPAFHRRVIGKFTAVIRHANERALGRWESAAALGEPLNLTESMSELALEIVLQSIFSSDLGQLVADLRDNPFMVVSRESKRDPRFAYQFRQLGRHVLEIMNRRRARNSERLDFMQLLMEARDPDTGNGMSERELLDEILTLVVAGHETTASALNWTWLLLARHPEIASRVREENDVAGDLGEAPFADIDRLPLTGKALREAMRLYPPGWILTRRSIGPDRLGGCSIPPGTDIFLSPYLTHRHAGFWDRPEVFDPAHFDPDRVENRHKFAYLPFGAGPRHCIGENFSMYEMVLHLNTALRRYALSEIEQGPIAMEARINLRTAGDIYMRVKKR